MLPDGNNVRGEVVVPFFGGMRRVARALRRGGWSVEVRKSRQDGARRIFVRSDRVELETEPDEGRRHTFSGAVDEGEGDALVARMSELLRGANVRHRLELYDPGGTLSSRHEHRWPLEMV